MHDGAEVTAASKYVFSLEGRLLSDVFVNVNYQPW